MKKLLCVLGLLTIVLFSSREVRAGANCPSNAQLLCGRSCDSAAATCNSRCDHWTTWQVTEGCRMECDTDLTACYNNCAVYGGCAAI